MSQQYPECKEEDDYWNGCEAEAQAQADADQAEYENMIANLPVSLCSHCHCITKTIEGKCGKCRMEKK